MLFLNNTENFLKAPHHVIKPGRPPPTNNQNLAVSRWFPSSVLSLTYILPHIVRIRNRSIALGGRALPFAQSHLLHKSQLLRQ